MKTFFICILSFLFTIAYAQQEKDFYHHEFHLTGGLNSQSAFEFEPAYSFLFNKYLGVTLGMSVFDYSFDLIDFVARMVGVESYYDDYDHYYDINMALFLRPAVRFRFPLIKDEVGDLLFLNIEPGAFLNIASNNHGSYSSKFTNEKLFVHLKSYLTMAFDRWQVAAGCGLSNFDASGNHRDKLKTISFLVSLSYCF